MWCRENEKCLMRQNPAVFVLAMSAGMAVFELAENRFGKLAR
jgi:hypothetical protein